MKKYEVFFSKEGNPVIVNGKVSSFDFLPYLKEKFNVNAYAECYEETFYCPKDSNGIYLTKYLLIDKGKSCFVVFKTDTTKGNYWRWKKYYIIPI